MEIKDISLDGKPWNTLGKRENPTDNSDFDGVSVGKEKIESLKQSIVEIKQLIEEREKLSKKMVNEAEGIKIDITNFFVENPAGEQEVREKIALKQKQVDISELQLKEKVSSWQDVARLKQELREKEQELAEKESRLNMLDKILEE